MTPLMCIASAFVTSNNRGVVDRSPCFHCIYLDNLQPVNEGFILQNYARAEEEIKTDKKEKNTALHIACKLGNVNMTKILLTTSKDQN
ncbi:ankyrin repeat family protein [Wolbachia endosymbiont of Trichogramma pretiosum]|nr:ankyrin repeat family protein [Wolbachia endosymbiont of Trichogramma pretiosum]